MNSVNKKDFFNTKLINTLVICPFINYKPIAEYKDRKLDEAEELARSIDLNVIDVYDVFIKLIKPSIYFGKGFLDKVINTVHANSIHLIVIDAALSPIQQRNLEIELRVKVIDRTGLILEIFGKRAKTREGILQVELAHLNYQKTRLVRSWTHLERQRGGAGFLGGPGEKQIELDKRIINKKITKIQKDIEKVKKTRKLHRESRAKVPFPLIALVGYTNAGKSTLFNKLTNSEVHVENKLFATLDPTMRVMILESGMEVIISDTVGFISELPHELIASFRATLEEVHSADIIINVRDISNPDFKRHNKDVLNILETILENKDTPIINVFSKCDLFNEEELLEIDNRKNNNNFYISSYTGYGIKVLKNYIETQIIKYKQKISVSVSLSDGKTLAWLYQNGQVISRNDTSNEAKIDILLNKKELNILEANNSFLSYE